MKTGESYQPYAWSFTRTALEKLSDRILNPPTGYCDEPQSFGDSIVQEMREAYQTVPGEGWFRRLLNKTSFDVVSSRTWKMYLAVSRYIRIPSSEERRAFEALLEDKARLDYLESMMMDRMVSLHGNCRTEKAQPLGSAMVHLNGIGYMSPAESFREAIDNARAFSLKPVELKPLELHPL